MYDRPSFRNVGTPGTLSGLPSVSIIIPVYNVERFIERSLRSVMAQTYPGYVECLLVDDATPDASMQIARNVLAGYDGPIHFHMLAHEQNRGLSAARNTGMYAAECDYVYFLDSDDEMTPDALEKLCGVAMQCPGVDVVTGNAYCYGPYKSLMLKPGAPAVYISARKAREVYLRGHDVLPTAWNQLVRRDFILQNALMFPEGLLHEDNSWRFDIGRHIASLAVCFDKTYHYHLNDSGIMSTVSEARLDSLTKLGVILQLGLESELAREQVRMLLKFFANSVGMCLRGQMPEGGFTKSLGSQIADMMKYCSTRTGCKMWDNSVQRRLYLLGFKGLDMAMRLRRGGGKPFARLLHKGVCFFAE